MPVKSVQSSPKIFGGAIKGRGAKVARCGRPHPPNLLGVDFFHRRLRLRKTTEGYLSILKWLSKKGLFYIEIIPLVKPTLGYQFPGTLNSTIALMRVSFNLSFLGNSVLLADTLASCHFCVTMRDCTIKPKPSVKGVSGN